MAVKNFTRNCGASSLPGIKGKIFYACACDVESMPAKTTGPNLGDDKCYDGQIVLKPGTSWGQIDILSNTGKIRSTLVGEDGSKCFENRLDFRTSGSNKAARAFADLVANRKIIAVVCLREEQQGTQNLGTVLGTIEDPAYFETLELDSGATKTDANGAAYTLYDPNGQTPCGIDLTLYPLTPILA